VTSKGWFIKQLQIANSLLKNKSTEEIINLIDATFRDNYWSPKFTTLGVLEKTQNLFQKPNLVANKQTIPAKNQPKVGEIGSDGKVVVETDFDEKGNYIEDWHERAMRRIYKRTKEEK